MSNKYTRSLVIVFLFLLPLQALFAQGTGSGSSESVGAEYSNPFSDYVPYIDEYDVDEDERFMYFGRSFGVGLGTGVHTFGGNLGNLYNTALPVFDFRLLYFFDFRFAGQMGINSSAHAYDASPDGFVEVNLFRINFDLKYYIDTKNLSATVTAASPYVIAGVSQVFRTRSFTELADGGDINRDTALGINAGFGLEFMLSPRKVSLGTEFRYHEIFFKERFSDIFAEVGVPDQTGPLYSVLMNVMFFF